MLCEESSDIQSTITCLIDALPTYLGLCGPIELLLVHSYVTQLVGLSVDCPYTHSFLGPPHIQKNEDVGNIV